MGLPKPAGLQGYRVEEGQCQSVGGAAETSADEQLDADGMALRLQAYAGGLRQHSAQCRCDSPDISTVQVRQIKHVSSKLAFKWSVPPE